MTRQKLCIDSGWKFYKGEVVDAHLPDMDISKWQNINIPHDYSIEGPFDPDNYLWCGYLPKGIAWYRRELELPSIEGKYFLEFEGVFRNSTVWVNGKNAGSHKHGYTGFIYDITSLLNTDGSPNAIAVKIDNPDNREAEHSRGNEGWWYEGCGIYRHVWLIHTNPIHVDRWGSFITTPQISDSEALVNVRCTIRNDFDYDSRCTVTTHIYSPNGSQIAVASDVIGVPEDSSQTIEQQITVDKPCLWSPDSPNLYKAKIEIHINSKLEDEYTTDFGIRSFEFTSDKGFFLNGKHMQLRGMCNHHDFGGLGVALPDRANIKTIELMKSMGCNILRSSHNDAAPALMDACDRLGMLVWAETRYLDDPEIAGEPLRDLIRRNRNHPSIICWGLANTAGSPDGKSTPWLKGLHEIAHEEDSTRPSAFACEANTDANANGFAMVTDIMGYNGGGMGIDDRDHQLYPDRKMLVTEFSSGRGARGIYVEKPSEAEEITLGDGRVVKQSGQYFTIYDLCRQFELEWSHIAERPWLAGGIMWSGIEYWGETCGWPVVTSQFGVLDLCRFPKDTFYYFLQEWTSEPMVHIFPHWNWQGHEGEIIDVWCYSNCEEVELVLNGESLGSQKTKPLTHLEWKVPYASGSIKAIGKISGKTVTEHEIKTSGPAAELKLSADRNTIKSDGTDLSFITVAITDKDGVFVPTACDRIKIEVTGGRLLGLGSGDPVCHENPKTDNMPAFNGLLLAIVQSRKSDGNTITVNASADGMAMKSIQISAVPE